MSTSYASEENESVDYESGISSGQSDMESDQYDDDIPEGEGYEEQEEEEGEYEEEQPEPMRIGPEEMMRMTVATHPVDQVNEYNHSQLLVFTVPSSILQSRTRRYTEMSPETTGGASNHIHHTYLRTVLMFIEIAHSVYNQDETYVRGKIVGSKTPGMFRKDGLLQPRVRVLIEHLLDSGGLFCGYRIFVVGIDPALNLNLQLEKVLGKNHVIMCSVREGLGKKTNMGPHLKRKSEAQTFRLVETKSLYFSQMVKPYFAHDETKVFDLASMEGFLSSDTSLGAEGNPFAITSLFQLSTALNHVNSKHATDLQRTVASYTKNGCLSFPYPGLVWMLSQEELDPEVFYTMYRKRSKYSTEVEETLCATMLPLTSKTTLDVKTFLKTKNPDLHVGPDQTLEDVLLADVIAQEMVRSKHVFEKMKMCLEDNYHEFCRTIQRAKITHGQQFWETLVKSVKDPDIMSKAVRSFITHLLETTAEALQCSNQIIADNLSLAANFILRFYWSVASYGHLRAGHMPRSAMQWLSAALEPVNPVLEADQVRGHQLSINGGSTGKSVILRIVTALSVQGTYMTITMATENSKMTSDNAMDRMIIGDHEGSPDKYGFGFKNSDDSVVKNLLSEGAVSKSRAVFDKATGKTTFVMEYSLHRSVYLICMNAPLPSERQGSENAVLHRFMISKGSTGRTGKNKATESATEAAIKSIGEKSSPENQIFRQQAHNMHALVALYNFYAEAGDLAMVHLTEFDTTWFDMCARVVKLGLPDPGPRFGIQLRRMVHNETLRFAAGMTLGSELTYKLRFDDDHKPMKFKWELLLFMEKLAVALKQHVAYVLSMHEDEILPYVRFRICSALKDIVDETGGYTVMPHPQIVTRTANAVNVEADTKYRTFSTMPYERLVDEIRKKIGHDVTRNTVMAEIERMKLIETSSMIDGQKVHYAWLTISENPIRRRKELSIAESLISAPIQETHKEADKLPAPGWMMDQLKDIWSHKAAIPSRIIHLGAYKTNAKMLGYFDIVRNPNKTRVYVNESPDDITRSMTITNGVAIQSKRRAMQKENVLIYTEDEDVANVAEHLRDIGTPELRYMKREDSDSVPYDQHDYILFDDELDKPNIRELKESRCIGGFLPFSLLKRALDNREKYHDVYYKRFKQPRKYPEAYEEDLKYVIGREEVDEFVPYLLSLIEADPTKFENVMIGASVTKDQNTREAVQSSRGFAEQLDRSNESVSLTPYHELSPEDIKDASAARINFISRKRNSPPIAEKDDAKKQKTDEVEE